MTLTLGWHAHLGRGWDGECTWSAHPLPTGQAAHWTTGSVPADEVMGVVRRIAVISSLALAACLSLMMDEDRYHIIDARWSPRDKGKVTGGGGATPRVSTVLFNVSISRGQCSSKVCCSTASASPMGTGCSPPRGRQGPLFPFPFPPHSTALTLLSHQPDLFLRGVVQWLQSHALGVSVLQVAVLRHVPFSFFHPIPSILDARFCCRLPSGLVDLVCLYLRRP
jgi:hypothetical protein